MKSIAFRILAFCFVSVLMLSFAACGSPTQTEETTEPSASSTVEADLPPIDKAALLGNWSYSFAFPSFGIETFTQHLTLMFFEDNTFGFTPTEDAMRAEIQAHINELVLYASEASGEAMTVEQYYLANNTDEAGMVDAILQSLLQQGIKGTYETDGSRLYLMFGKETKKDDQYYLCSIENGQMQLSMPHDFTPAFSLAPPEQFPLTLSKV